MYNLLWKLLPGKRWMKIAQLVVLALLLVAFLFLVVFPYVDSTFAEDPNLNG